jgi:hypothetical protein
VLSHTRRAAQPALAVRRRFASWLIAAILKAKSAIMTAQSIGAARLKRKMFGGLQLTPPRV